MRRTFLMLVLALLATVPTLAEDPLAQATDAYRRGELTKAAQLFGAAAEAEPNPTQRAEIRVKQAWTFFAMKSRTRAEEALGQALDDSPNLELVRDYYTDDFIALANKVKARRSAAPASPTPTQPPARQPTPAPSSVPGLRQRLAAAVDNTAVEPLLAELQQIEATTAPAGLPEILELKGEILERLGRPGEALEIKGRVAALRAAAQAVPGTSATPLATLLEARGMLASGRAEDAVSLLRGVISAQTSCIPAMEILGEALLEANRVDEAYEALRMAMTGNEKADLLLLLGEVQLRRGRMADARQAFSRLVTIELGSDRGWAALGLLQARTGDVAAAKDCLDKALRLNPTLVEAQVVRAQIALYEDQPAVAMQRMQRAMQAKPDDPWVLGWLGFAHLAGGNAAAAAERLQAAVAGNQTRFAPVLAEALRRLGKPEQALAALDAWKTDDPRVAMLRAHCLLDLNKASQAEATVREQLPMSPDSAELHYFLGVALHAGGKWSAAVAELDQASRLPNSPAQAASGLAVARATEAADKLMNAAVVPPPPAPAK